MDLRALAGRIDVATARAFVTATRQVIDAMLIEGQRVEQVQTPGKRDYRTAELSREAAPGGWLSHAELQNTAQRLAEAVAAEKWADGLLFALSALRAVGGV